MSFVSSKFSAAKTGVFWNLDDCPIPDGSSPEAIYFTIKSALANMGYTGRMQIHAYSVEEQNKEEFESAEIELIHARTSPEKVNLMIKDVYLWGIKHRYEPTNVMVISEDLSNYDVSGLVHFKASGNNLLLAQLHCTSGVLRHVASSIWLWKSLSTGGSPRECYSMRPESATSSVTSTSSRKALRGAKKQMKRPTKSLLKKCKISRANPDPED